MTIAKARIATGIVVSVGAIAAFAGIASGRAARELPHGLSAGTSGLDRVPPMVAPAPHLLTRVEELARFAHADPTAASRNLRLVRSGLGRSRTNIYVFRNERGHPCIVVPDWIGFCEPDSGSTTPGLDWSIGGGDTQTPSKFIAVYSDDVATVTLRIDGENMPVSMANNVAYAELPAESRDAVFTAIRRDGSENSVSLDLAG